MTLTKQKLKRYGESMHINFTSEQENLILEMFGEEPLPFEWSEQDIYEQIMLILHDCTGYSKPLFHRASSNILKVDYSTRKKRRDAVSKVSATLSAICDAERVALNNVPENFQNSESFEIGEYAVEKLEEIIDLLLDVY